MEDEGRRPAADGERASVGNAGKPPTGSGPGGGGDAAPASTRILLRSVALVGQLGFTVVGGAAAGLLLGFALDRKLGTKPGFMIGGLLFGLAGGVLAAYRLLSAIGAVSRAADTEEET